MSEHDPLCPEHHADEWSPPWMYDCRCDLIRQAEQRGRESAYADYLHQKEPFAVWCMEQGMSNQRAAFEPLIDAAFAKGAWQGQRDALATKHHDPGERCDGCWSFATEEALAAAVQRVIDGCIHFGGTCETCLSYIDKIKGES